MRIEQVVEELHIELVVLDDEDRLASRARRGPKPAQCAAAMLYVHGVAKLWSRRRQQCTDSVGGSFSQIAHQALTNSLWCIGLREYRDEDAAYAGQAGQA